MKKTKYSTPEYNPKLGPTLIIIGIIFYGIFLVFPTCFLIYYLIKRPNILDILQNLPLLRCVCHFIISFRYYKGFKCIYHNGALRLWYNGRKHPLTQFKCIYHNAAARLWHITKLWAFSWCGGGPCSVPT